jgi:hypothetical protein
MSGLYPGSAARTLQVDPRRGVPAWSGVSVASSHPHPGARGRRPTLAGPEARGVEMTVLHLPVTSSVIWRCSSTAVASTSGPRWLHSGRPGAVTRYLSRSWGTPSCAPGLVSSARGLVDMAELGRNPARIIPALRLTAGKHRCIGEPSGPGRTAAGCKGDQARGLINLTFRDSLVTVVCPYDRAGLPGSVIVRYAHPAVKDRQATASVSYLGPPDVPPRYGRLCPPPVHAGRWASTTCARFAASSP